MVPARMPSPTPVVKRAAARPRVGVRELRQNLSVYLERVVAGERFDVTDRGQVVAMLVPSAPAATLLDRLIADGRAIPPAQDRAPLDGEAPGQGHRRRTAAHLGGVRVDARRPAVSFLPVYVDSSALLKLVLPEPERPRARTGPGPLAGPDLERHPGDRMPAHRQACRRPEGPSVAAGRGARDRRADPARRAGPAAGRQHRSREPALARRDSPRHRPVVRGLSGSLHHL